MPGSTIDADQQAPGAHKVAAYQNVRRKPAYRLEGRNLFAYQVATPAFVTGT